MTPQLIYCASGNKRFAETAIKYGFKYGAQLPHVVYYPPYFVDQDWKKPNRVAYMKALSEHRPHMASVLDWEEDAQFDEVMSWAEEASNYVTNDVIIIPKVIGGVHKIPREIHGKTVRLGYSIPTKFGGTKVPPQELEDFPTHLLGGSPMSQIEFSRRIKNVVSTDGNYCQKLAVSRNQFFACNASMSYSANKDFPKLDESVFGHITHDAPYLAFELSCMNIRAAWLGSVAMLRFAVEEDVTSIKSIANFYKQELGYVMYPSLRRAIEKRELLVACHKTRIVGFCNWHARRDGINTIYEIAVHPDWKGYNIGKALLKAVPNPVKLKCTVDNPANKFYESQGFLFSGREEGRNRPLNLWRRYAD